MQQSKHTNLAPKQVAVDESALARSQRREQSGRIENVKLSKEEAAMKQVRKKAERGEVMSALLT
jgi:hypothetical protein